MAEAANPDVIKFSCNKCQKKLRAPVKMAGRFLECPGCKNKTAVPGSQEEADEEAGNYDVNRMAYDVPEKCMKCGQKMKKKAVVCVNCGFDYRGGKQLQLTDKTIKEFERVTWAKVFMSMWDQDVIKDGVMLGIGYVVFYGGFVLLALGINWALSLLPVFPDHVYLSLSLGFTFIAWLFLLSGVINSLVVTCSRAATGRTAEPSTIDLVSYALFVFMIAYTPVWLCATEKAATVIIKPERIPAPAGSPANNGEFLFLLVGLAAVGGLYSSMAVGTLANEGSAAPWKVAQIFGQCCPEILLLYLIGAVMHVLYLLPVFIVWSMVPDPTTQLWSAAAALGFGAALLQTTYANMLGLIMRKKMDYVYDPPRTATSVRPQ